MADVYPKRDIVSEAFCDQRDVINKLLIEMQNQPSASYSKMKKRFGKGNGVSLHGQYHQVLRTAADEYGHEYHKLQASGPEYGGQYRSHGQYQSHGFDNRSHFDPQAQAFAPGQASSGQMYSPGVNTAVNTNSSDGSSTTSTPILTASIVSGSNSSSLNISNEAESKSYNFDPFKPLDLSKIDLSTSSFSNFETTGYNGSIWNSSNTVWG